MKSPAASALSRAVGGVGWADLCRCGIGGGGGVGLAAHCYDDPHCLQVDLELHAELLLFVSLLCSALLCCAVLCLKSHSIRGENPIHL